MENESPKKWKNKTQKIKKVFTREEKTNLWKQFQPEEQLIEKNDVFEDTTVCHQCFSDLVTLEDGFPVCSNPKCSIVYNNTLDYSPEWRFFGSDDKGNDPARCGNPINPLLQESSFGCRVLCSNNASIEMKKISKWTDWSVPHKEKTLYDEFQFIGSMAQHAGIPKIIVDDSNRVYKELYEGKMVRGLNRDGMKAASIYIACRLNNCPRTDHEIAEIFLLDDACATKGRKNAEKILKNPNLCAITPLSFVERFCSKLGLNEDLTTLATFVTRIVEKRNIIDDNTPPAITSGIIYYVVVKCYQPITKKDIFNISGISSVTIDKCYKKLCDYNELLIPCHILEKYEKQKGDKK
jgi:transcription initiation factor TFIIB